MLPTSLRKSTASLSLPTTPAKPTPQPVPLAEPLEDDYDDSVPREETQDPVDSDPESQEIEIVDKASDEEALDSDEDRSKPVRRVLFKKTVYWFKPEYPKSTPERPKNPAFGKSTNPPPAPKKQAKPTPRALAKSTKSLAKK